MTQVVSNLLSNAVKFVAPGVRPRVRIRSEPPIRSDKPDSASGLVRLWFEDNGLGISAGSLPRLFNLFTRLNDPRAYEGTGIGLAVVRKAIERMGGKVGVESQPGKGSRFWVDLRKAQP